MGYSLLSDLEPRLHVATDCGETFRISEPVFVWRIGEDMRRFAEPIAVAPDSSCGDGCAVLAACPPKCKA